MSSMSFEDYDFLQPTRRPTKESKDMPDIHSLVVGKVEVTQLEAGLNNDKPQVTLTRASKAERGNIYEDHSLVVRKRLKLDNNRKYQLYETLAEFRDLHIQKAFQELLKDFNYVNCASLPIVFKKPYRDLFYIRDSLKAYRISDSRREDERASLQVLVDFIEEQYLETLELYSGLDSNRFINFEYLWTLFPPASIIISEADGLRRVYRVIKCEDVIEAKETYLEIVCWGWGYDAGHFGRFETKLKVLKFDGTQQILGMEIYPLRSMPADEQVRLQEELIRGGRKWKEMISVCHKTYKGKLPVASQK